MRCRTRRRCARGWRGRGWRGGRRPRGARRSRPRAARGQRRLGDRAIPTDAELEHSLDTVLTVRTSTDAVEEFGPDLLAAIAARAPRARLRLVGEGDESAADVRSGA